MTCTVAGCTRPHEAKGLCHSHFEWQRRHGVKPTHRLASDIPWTERFHARTTPGENGCILWTAATASEGRYGMCWYQGRIHPAHVVAYLAFVEDYDRSLDIDHTCGVTLCVNPDHLEPVTHRENVLRGRSHQAVNAKKLRCIRGHDLTDERNIRRFGPDKRWRCCNVCRRIRARARRKATASGLVAAA